MAAVIDGRYRGGRIKKLRVGRGKWIITGNECGGVERAEFPVVDIAVQRERAVGSCAGDGAGMAGRRSRECAGASGGGPGVAEPAALSGGGSAFAPGAGG